MPKIDDRYSRESMEQRQAEQALKDASDAAKKVARRMGRTGIITTPDGSRIEWRKNSQGTSYAADLDDISSIPELGPLFKSLEDIAGEIKGEDLSPGDTEDKIEIIDILRPGTGEELGPMKMGPRGSGPGAKSLQDLFDIADAWGNGSKVSGVSLNKNKYRAAILYDENGEVEAIVADSPAHKNAVYIWRRDVSVEKVWTRVFGGDKKTAQKFGAITLRHGTNRPEVDRILDFLTMPADDALDEVTRPKNQKRKF